MARIYLSPLIVDIRNKQSDTVFSKWKGINYIRSRVIPANPKTADQIAIRTALKDLVKMWQTTHYSMKYNWNFHESGKDRSGFNYWIGLNAVDERDGNLLQITLDNGYDKLTTWTAATGSGAKEIDITFAPTPVPAGKQIRVYIREANSLNWDTLTYFNSAATSPQTVACTLGSTLYEIYGSIIKTSPASGDEVGESSSTTGTSHA